MYGKIPYAVEIKINGDEDHIPLIWDTLSFRPCIKSAIKKKRKGNVKLKMNKNTIIPESISIGNITYKNCRIKS